MKKDNPLWILAVVFIALLLIFNLVLFIKKSEYAGKINSSEGGDYIGDYIGNYREDSASVNVSFEGKTSNGKRCPDAYGGNEKAFLHIKYFYSDFCPWCRKEEPILQKLVKEQGNLVHIAWYNIDNCQDLVEKYKVSGVPTLVFSTTDNPAEYSHYGFTYEKDLRKLICDVTGGC